MYRQIGAYSGQILEGAKFVVQSTKCKLVIDVQTAKVLDLEVPPTLLATAEEVIE